MSMRQLRTCDFCGSDAAGIYEVVPPELSPTEAEQRRVVLCDDCLETLETVVSPLLARLGVEGTGAGTETDDGGRRSASPEPVPAAEDADELEGGANRDRPLDPAADDTTTEVTPMTESDGDGVRADEGKPAVDETRQEDYEVEDAAENAEEDPRAHVDADDAPTVGGSGGATAADAATDGTGDGGAGGTDPADHTDETVQEPAEDYEVDEPDRRQEPDTEDPEEDYEVVEDVADVEDEGDGGESVGDEPPNFRKVMRLMNNRNFPVDRAEITDVASGAYDLDRGQVDDIIDHAIQRDVLTEEGGQLHKT